MMFARKNVSLPKIAQAEDKENLFALLRRSLSFPKTLHKKKR